MSEAAHNDLYKAISSIPPQPELSLVVSATEHAPHQPFDAKQFIQYLDKSHTTDSIALLVRLLEQLGALPSELDSVQEDITTRQQFFDHILGAQTIFAQEYKDSADVTTINRQKLATLYDETEKFDQLPELQAFDELTHYTVSDSRFLYLKHGINKAEWLYRIFLSKEKGNT